jgi:DNA-damage-inducible protein D
MSAELITLDLEVLKIKNFGILEIVDFHEIRSKGDEALFGGHSTKQMKKKLAIPEKRPLADFLPTVTIVAKNFATEITNFNVKQNNLNGESKITDEHVKNNDEMRRVLAKNKIVPENLPAEVDIKLVEKKVKKEENRLVDKKRKKLD